MSDWWVWAGFLVTAYLAVGLAGWHRTLLPDEIWALLHAGRPLDEQLESIRFDLVHPPLIYLIERAWMWAFGETDGAAKALALVINIPTIGLFTWLARRITRHWRVACVLFCASTLCVGSVCTLVRMYGLVVLLTVGALVLWERWRTRPEIVHLFSWALVMLLLIYTHYFGTLLLMAFMVVNLALGTRRNAFAIAATLVGLMAIPWLLYVLPIYASRGLGPNLGGVDRDPFSTAVKLPYYFLTSIPSSWNPFERVSWLDGTPWRRVLIMAADGLILTLLALAASRLWRLWRSQNDWPANTRWLWPMVILTAVPPILLYAFALTVAPAFHSRFLTGILPIFWLLVALCAELGGAAGSRLLFGIVLPVVLLSAGAKVVENASAPPAREYVALLQSQVRNTDLILCDDRVGHQVYWEWTRRLHHPARMEILTRALSPWWGPELPLRTASDLDIGGARRVWLCYYNEKRIAKWKSWLNARGFTATEQLRTTPPFLQAFVSGPPSPTTSAEPLLKWTTVGRAGVTASRLLRVRGHTRIGARANRENLAVARQFARSGQPRTDQR